MHFRSIHIFSIHIPLMHGEILSVGFGKRR